MKSKGEMAAKKSGPTHVMIVYAEPKAPGIYKMKKRVVKAEEAEKIVKAIREHQQKFLKEAGPST